LAVTVGRPLGGFNRQIILVDTLGRELRALTTGLGDADSPSWSPDGATIAYFNNGYTPDTAQRGWGINLVAVDGSAMRRLVSTSGLAGAGAPAWSPTGSLLAFTCLRRGICVVGADGSGLRTVLEGNFSTVAWSPAGGALAFTERIDSAYRSSLRVGVVNADGSGKRYLTGGPSASDPAWSPDGSSLAYASERDGNVDLYTVDLLTGRERRLTTSPDAERRPAWAPRRSR
jgi:Tol biopolymer transport system component